VDEIQAKIDELEPPQGTSSTGKASTGTSPGSTGMKQPSASSAPVPAKPTMPAKAPMARM